MNWNELETIWRTHRQGPVAPAWSIGEFEEKHRVLARTYAWRDWFEAAVFALLGFLLAAVLVWLKIRGWPGWIAVALAAMVCLFFLRERWLARQAHPPAEAPLVERLDAEIRFLRRQHRLLATFHWWFLLPILLATALFVWAVVDSRPWPLRVPRGLTLTWLGGTCVLIAALVLHVVRQAMRTWLEPQLRDREQARAAFTPPDSDSYRSKIENVYR